MDRVNTDLMLQNLCLMEDNERLRMIARQLDQDNKKMLADLKLKQQHMAASSRTAAAAQMAPGGASSGATAARHNAAAPAPATKYGKHQRK